MLVVSSRLGPYEIVAPIGAGGMGEVYRARDTRLGREVAVKVLPEEFANSPDARARFEREARAVAALSHPSILSIHDYGTHETITYAVMELLEGQTLRSRLSQGPLPWREAVEVGASIADGLAAAHAKGIVHRDLKPENLFLTDDGRVKILDFGLARMLPAPSSPAETGPYVPAETVAGTVMGTVGYMSPEQVRGQPADAPSDLFSFGCVLYEMLSGQRAFQRETAAETMTAILHDEPEPTTSGQQVPAELGRLIRQCLAKNPHQRLQSARDLSLGLRAVASDPALHRVAAARRPTPLVSGMVAALLFIGAIGSAVYFQFTSDSRFEAGDSAAVAKGIESLAVLPFENVGGDPQTEWLSDGIPDTIIHSLSHLRQRDLRVQSLTSVARYKGRKPDPAELRRDLGVSTVVTGRLQQRGDNLSVSVSLIDARDGRELWGRRYDKMLPDLLALQDEIAKDVAANLRLHLTGEEERRLTHRDTENTEAYQLYLRGRYHWNKRSREGLEKSIEYFRQAIEQDPNYALAWAGLADAYQVFPVNTDSPPNESYPKAKAAALAALKIDDSLAEARATLAAVATFYEWDWTAAEREFQRAIEQNPNYAPAHQWYGEYLSRMGRFSEAKVQLDRARQLEPLSLIVNSVAGKMSYYARLHDDAIDQYKKTLEIDKEFWVAHFFLGQAYAQQGKYEEAIAELQRPGTWPGPHPLIGYIYARMGKEAEAQRVLDEVQAVSNQQYVSPYYVALIYAGLGRKDDAFAWLEKAFEDRSFGVGLLKVEPMVDNLRGDPRFTDLLRRVGLADKVAGREQVIQAVAVLPFTCTEGDPTTEMLSETLAGHISDSLRQVGRRDLKIRPPSSVSRYVRQRPDTLTIGRELNVPLIVTGTMRTQGNNLTITAEVVDAREDNLLWRKPYTCQRSETLDLDVQDQIVQDIAANLGLRLSDDEQGRLTRRRTADRDAYNLYRETMFHLSKFTPEGLTAGIKSGKQAIEKDPKYALAYSAVARCCILRGTLYEGPRKAFPEARTYVDEALKLDPNLPDAHTALAIIHFFDDWDWVATERELKQAIALDPGVPITWNILGFSLAAQNQLPEALVAIRRGQELDPLSPPRRHELAMCYNWMRDPDRAIVEAEKVQELDPNFPLAYREHGLAYLQKEMPEKAIEVLKAAVDRPQRHPRVKGMLGYAYVAAGRTEEARGVLEELKGLSPGRFGIAFSIAQIHAALGEPDAAFEWLQKALDERDSSVVWLKVDATMDSLHSDPRFAQILRDMRLPP